MARLSGLTFMNNLTTEMIQMAGPLCHCMKADIEYT